MPWEYSSYIAGDEATDRLLNYNDPSAAFREGVANSISHGKATKIKIWYELSNSLKQNAYILDNGTGIIRYMDFRKWATGESIVDGVKSGPTNEIIGMLGIGKFAMRQICAEPIVESNNGNVGYRAVLLKNQIGEEPVDRADKWLPHRGVRWVLENCYNLPSLKDLKKDLVGWFGWIMARDPHLQIIVDNEILCPPDDAPFVGVHPRDEPTLFKIKGGYPSTGYPRKGGKGELDVYIKHVRICKIKTKFKAHGPANCNALWPMTSRNAIDTTGIEHQAGAIFLDWVKHFDEYLAHNNFDLLDEKETAASSRMVNQVDAILMDGLANWDKFMPEQFKPIALQPVPQVTEKTLERKLADRLAGKGPSQETEEKTEDLDEEVRKPTEDGHRNLIPGGETGPMVPGAVMGTNTPAERNIGAHGTRTIPSEGTKDTLQPMELTHSQRRRLKKQMKQGSTSLTSDRKHHDGDDGKKLNIKPIPTELGAEAKKRAIFLQHYNDTSGGDDRHPMWFMAPNKIMHTVGNSIYKGFLADAESTKYGPKAIRMMPHLAHVMMEFDPRLSQLPVRDYLAIYYKVLWAMLKAEMKRTEENN